MMNRPLRCVVDASVAVKLAIDEPLSDRAECLFAHLASDRMARFYVPDLFYAECANVLWKCTRRTTMPPAAARRGLRLLRELSLDVIPTARVAARALEIAMQKQITTYDACYVATARLVRAPLVTADQRLAAAFGRRVGVLWLGELEYQDDKGDEDTEEG